MSICLHFKWKEHPEAETKFGCFDIYPTEVSLIPSFESRKLGDSVFSDLEFHYLPERGNVFLGKGLSICQSVCYRSLY